MSKTRKKKSPKRVLALPDLEQAKSAVLNTLTSLSGQQTYDPVKHLQRDIVVRGNESCAVRGRVLPCGRRRLPSGGNGR